MMSLIILASATGSPGVTTSALGMALTWPRDVLLCDADRDPSQAVLAGYLNGVDAGMRSIANLARQHRDAPMTIESILAETVPLTSDETPSRRFLPGFTHPGSAAIFRAAWPGFADMLAYLGNTGTDTIVDAGRIGREGLPAPLLANAQLVLVVVRSTLRSLAAARLYLPYLRDHMAQVGGLGQLALLVVGPGRPYSPSDIEAEFGVPIWGSIPLQVDAVVLSDGDQASRRFADGPLMRSFRALSSHTRTAFDTTQAHIDAGRPLEMARS